MYSKFVSLTVLLNLRTCFRVYCDEQLAYEMCVSCHMCQLLHSNCTRRPVQTRKSKLTRDGELVSPKWPFGGCCFHQKHGRKL